MSLLAKIIRPIGIADVLIVFCTLAALGLQMSNFANDPGVGWHLMTGQSIVRDGIFPYTQTFLGGPFAQSRWIADQWLSDVLIYRLFSFGGYALVYATLAVIFFWSYLSLLYKHVVKITGSFVVSCFAILFAFKVSQVHFILRPTVFGFAFFIPLYMMLTSLYEEAFDASKRLRRLYVALPLLFLVWANMHGSFAIGLILMACLLLGMALDRLLLERQGAWATEKGLALLIVLCTLVTFINPNGIELHKSIIELGRSQYFMQLHMEWRGPNFRESEGQFWEILVFVPVLSFLLFPKRDGERLGFYIVALLAFCHLSLQAVRVLPYLGIVATIPWTRAFTRLATSKVLQSHKFFANFAPHLDSFSKREQRSYGGVFLLPLLAATLFVALTERRVLFGPSELGPTKDKFPYEAVAYLDRTLSQNEAIVAADPEWGGFLTWYGHGKIKAIIDDRNLLFGEKFYKQYFASLKPGESIDKFLVELGASHLLLKKESVLAAYLTKTGTYQRIFEDRVAILFDVRTKFDNRSIEQ